MDKTRSLASDCERGADSGRRVTLMGRDDWHWAKREDGGAKMSAF